MKKNALNNDKDFWRAGFRVSLAWWILRLLRAAYFSNGAPMATALSLGDRKKLLPILYVRLSRAVYRARTAAVLQGLSINERALSSSSAKEIETVERQQQQASRSTNYKYTNKFNLAP